MSAAELGAIVPALMLAGSAVLATVLAIPRRTGPRTLAWLGAVAAVAVAVVALASGTGSASPSLARDGPSEFFGALIAIVTAVSCVLAAADPWRVARSKDEVGLALFAACGSGRGRLRGGPRGPVRRARVARDSALRADRARHAERRRERGPALRSRRDELGRRAVRHRAPVRGNRRNGLRGSWSRDPQPALPRGAGPHARGPRVARRDRAGASLVDRHQRRGHRRGAAARRGDRDRRGRTRLAGVARVARGARARCTGAGRDRGAPRPPARRVRDDRAARLRRRGGRECRATGRRVRARRLLRGRAGAVRG